LAATGVFSGVLVLPSLLPEEEDDDALLQKRLKLMGSS
jgi:hypothetical protein